MIATTKRLGRKIDAALEGVPKSPGFLSNKPKARAKPPNIYLSRPPFRPGRTHRDFGPLVCPSHGSRWWCASPASSLVRERFFHRICARTLVLELVFQYRDFLMANRQHRLCDTGPSPKICRYDVNGLWGPGVGL